MMGLRAGTSAAAKGSQTRRFCVAALEPGRDAGAKSASPSASAASSHMSRLLSFLPGLSLGRSAAQPPAGTSPSPPVPGPGPVSRTGSLLPHATVSPSAPAPLSTGGSSALEDAGLTAPRPSGSSLRSPHFPATQLPAADGTDAETLSRLLQAAAMPLPGADPAPPLPSDDSLLSDRRHSAAAASSSAHRGATRLHHRSHHPHSPHHRHHRQRHPESPAPMHPTLRLIASRLRSGSAPGARSDGARLGLVVEGGGMRGCISGAMLMALHDLGVTRVFDAVYGASAGAINATYFLAGQRQGLRVYYEDLTRGSAFLDFRNLFSSSSRPVMNIDFLIDEVMVQSKPLDWDAVLASPAPLKVVASCLDSLQPVLLDGFADRVELAEALKATAAVPAFAGPPRRLRGRTLVDAAVFEAVPVPSAIRDGCDHLLVLCTRPAPTRRSPLMKHMRDTVETLAKTTVLNAPYMREAWRTARSPAISQQEEALVAALRSCPHDVAARMGAYVLPLYPDSTAGCHPLCLDPPTLMAACEEGRTALLRLLGPVVAAAAAEGAEEVESVAAAGGEWGLAAGGEFGDAELYSPGMEQRMQYRP